jgi:hypothetical protein
MTTKKALREKTICADWKKKLSKFFVQKNKLNKFFCVAQIWKKTVKFFCAKNKIK